MLWPFVATPQYLAAQTPAEVVKMHLRTVESGNFDLAAAQLSDDYKMRMNEMPFFVPSIKKNGAFEMHRARKTAFPDFKFNEKIEWEKGNQVRIAVFLTGTHTGLLDYPKRTGVPRTEATGKKIDLPAEYFTYTVENGKITACNGEIPKGNGPTALKKQLGIQ